MSRHEVWESCSCGATFHYRTSWEPYLTRALAEFRTNHEHEHEHVYQEGTPAVTSAPEQHPSPTPLSQTKGAEPCPE